MTRVKKKLIDRELCIVKKYLGLHKDPVVEIIAKDFLKFPKNL